MTRFTTQPAGSPVRPVPVDGTTEGSGLAMTYHALWVGQLTLTPAGVAKCPTWSQVQALRIRAQIGLASWGQALDGSTVSLPIAGQVLDGLGGGGPLMRAPSAVEVARRAGKQRYWTCAVRTTIVDGGGRRWLLELAPEAACAVASSAGCGELATLTLREVQSGQPASLLATGSCRMSLRYFLHQLSADPLS